MMWIMVCEEKAISACVCVSFSCGPSEKLSFLFPLRVHLSHCTTHTYLHLVLPAALLFQTSRPRQSKRLNLTFHSTEFPLNWVSDMDNKQRKLLNRESLWSHKRKHIAGLWTPRWCLCTCCSSQHRYFAFLSFLLSPSSKVGSLLSFFPSLYGFRREAHLTFASFFLSSFCIHPSEEERIFGLSLSLFILSYTHTYITLDSL